jgi:hypothetical protein
MDTNKIDSARRFYIPHIPFARGPGRHALLLAGAALCTPTVGWAVPLLGAAQSFVVLDGSSLAHGGANANGGGPGGSEGKARSANGGSFAEGNLHRGDAPLSAGAASSAVRTSLTPRRNEDRGHRDGGVDVIASAVSSILPCAAQDQAGNSLGASNFTQQVKCVSKTAELNLSDIPNAIHHADALLVGKIDSGLTLTSLVSSDRDEMVSAINSSLAVMRGVEIGDVFTSESVFSSDRRVKSANPALNRPGLIVGLQDSPAAPASTITPVSPAAISVNAIPEPSVLALFGLGLMALVGLARRR